jgi:hypothetical protein
VIGDPVARADILVCPMTICQAGLFDHVACSFHAMRGMNGNTPHCLCIPPMARYSSVNGKCESVIAKKLLAQGDKLLYPVFFNF